MTRTQLGQFAYDYLMSYADGALPDTAPDDFTPEQLEWVETNATSLTRHLENAVEGYMIDVDYVPGEEDDDS